MDMQQGLICSLTDASATFSGECPDFDADPTVKLSTEPLEPQALKRKAPTDVYQRLILEQNLSLALVAGVSVGIVGAIIWGAITVATGYQIGYMAVAIGAGVGLAMRYAGKGVDQIFGIAGGAVAVLSCVFGNFLSLMGFVANTEGLSYIETLSLFDYSFLLPALLETFSVMDLVFYAIAGYEGYKFAFRVLSEKDVAAG